MLLSFMVYHRILNIVPHAIQWDLVYPFCVEYFASAIEASLVAGPGTQLSHIRAIPTLCHPHAPHCHHNRTDLFSR